LGSIASPPLACLPSVIALVLISNLTARSWRGYKTQEEAPMPFVNIRILEGHSQARKDEITRRVTDAISEVAELPKEMIWVVFEDVKANDWYVGDQSVQKRKAKAK
jgi:4-oxalocrotonate tautomerase